MAAWALYILFLIHIVNKTIIGITSKVIPPKIGENIKIETTIPIILKASIAIEITPEVIKVLISSTSFEKYASRLPVSRCENVIYDSLWILFSISILIVFPTPWDKITSKTSFKKLIRPIAIKSSI